MTDDRVKVMNYETPHYDVMGGAARWQVDVHDHGLVALVDVMPRLAPEGKTADFAIVQAARVSYGAGTKQVSEDNGLVRYLMRHRHTTPLEMVEFKFHCVMPIFVARQWIRHRTACITGDTLLQFDLPGGVVRCGSQLDSLSVGEVYERFQPTRNATRPDKQRNPYHRRDRVQAKLLRCVDESTGLVAHTNIVDVWQSGEKDVWEIRYEGWAVTASADHLFLTDSGWRKLGEIADLNTGRPSTMRGGARLSWIGPGIETGVVPSFNVIETETEEWLPVTGWEAYYEVSDQGRVRRIIGGRGSARGRCKVLTVTDGRAVVSLNRPGEQETRLVHQLMAEAFIGPRPDGMEVCHEDGNSLNNTVDNLRYGTKQSNAADRIRDGATTSLRRNFVIPTIRYAGRQITYDLEVAGPWHNFSAAGFVVHNSVNEYSARYSVVKDRFFRPSREEIRLQSAANRQGRADEADSATADAFLEYLDDAEAMYARYEDMIARGVARETARIGLPLSVYTEWYWKIDLHNLFHFLGLRMDAHAQKEIRDYAEAMFALIQPIVPVACQAFLDYRLNAVSLSSLEVEAIRTGRPLASENKREAAEWEDKKGHIMPQTRTPA